MKIKTDLKNIWIVTLLSLGLFLFAIRQCNAQPYISFNVDANNLLNIKENKRTIVNGLDFDIEVGAIENNIGVYVFYGMFYNANYQNYGVGVDYIINPLENVYLSLGNQYHVTIRNKKQKYLGTTDSYFNPRGKISYDLSFLTIDLIAKFTKRNDIDKRIFEGSVGVTKKLN
jgi:hypothetical protein